MDKNILTQYLSEKQLLQVEQYLNLLLKWNKKINLTSRQNSRKQLYSFCLEAVALTKLIPDNNAVIVDFGSGGGFPTIILAILGYININMVEIITKKASFLQFVIAELGLKAAIYNQDIAKVQIHKVDYVISKAVSALQNILRLTKHLQPKEIIICSKSGTAVEVGKTRFYFKLVGPAGFEPATTPL
jgi:16S rRNA (guanine527-N7)-methyltransferase